MLLGDFLRRLGAAADTTVRSAAQVAAEEERDRARLLLHDHGSLLAVLADRVDDAALRRQSRRAANEIAGFLAGPAGWDPIPEGTVADVVREAAAPFSDLPLTVTVELASRVELDPERADVLAGGRHHPAAQRARPRAHARSVVVHADADVDDDDGSSWEVTVRDDGVGFDPATTPAWLRARPPGRRRRDARGDCSSTSGPPPGRGRWSGCTPVRRAPTARTTATRTTTRPTGARDDGRAAA